MADGISLSPSFLRRWPPALVGVILVLRGRVRDAQEGVGEVFHRSANSSRTLLLENNAQTRGVYVLHGDSDTTVPVAEARFMRERLGRFHPNFAYYEKADAGHWWGNECMDWPPLIEFLQRQTLPLANTVLEVDFSTVNPALAARLHWLEILQQDKSMAVSRLKAKFDPDSGSLDGGVKMCTAFESKFPTCSHN